MTGVALAHCILGKFFGVVCHCFPPPLDVPTFAARCLYVRNDARDPSSERWNCGRERCPVILSKFRLPHNFRDLLHAANLRHGTDGFTSPLKEGVLRIFCNDYIGYIYRLFEVICTVAAYFVQSCYACGSCTVQSGTPHNARSTHFNFGEAQAESSLMMVYVNRNMLEQLL